MSKERNRETTMEKMHCGLKSWLVFGLRNISGYENEIDIFEIFAEKVREGFSSQVIQGTHRRRKRASTYTRVSDCVYQARRQFSDGGTRYY